MYVEERRNMYSRDDINVYKSKDTLHSGKHYFIVEIRMGDKVYGSSFSRAEDAGHAINSLFETVVLKTLGITKTDFILKVGDFFFKEGQNAEEGADAGEGQADRSSGSST
jgi:hypothetical protein